MASRIRGAPLSAHLATTFDDRPHVAPVWYGYRNGVLYFMTGGKKLENVRRNPRVAISIEHASKGSVEWSVTLLGRAEVSDNPDRVEWASEWIYDAYNDDSEDANTEEKGVRPDGREGYTIDGGVSERDHALVEVTIGSTSMNVYE